MFEGWSKKKYKYPNTRRHIRLPIAWPTKIIDRDDSVTEATPADNLLSTSDVSAGGLGLTIPYEIEVGKKITIEIHIPPLNKSIRANAHVVRCVAGSRGGYDLGIRFDDISEEDQAALTDAVEAFYSPRARIKQQGNWWRKIQ